MNLSLSHLAISTPSAPRLLLVVVALIVNFMLPQDHELHRPRNLLVVDAAAQANRNSLDPV